MRKILSIFLMVLSLSFAFVLTSCDKEVDLSGVTFADATYDYDGTPKKVEVKNLPDGLIVEYVPSNKQKEPGVYNIVATIKNEKGKVLKELVAKLTIIGEEETQDPTTGEIESPTDGESGEGNDHTCDFTGEWKKDTTNHWHECSCGEIDTPVAHAWNAGEVTVEPTATTKGKKVYTCTVCSQTKEEELPEVTHTCAFGTEWKKDATDHWLECECGETSEKAAHTWDEGEVTVQPTEEAEGKKVYNCTVCSQTKEESLEKLAHTHKHATTLSKDENQHWYECACGDKKDAADHNYDGGWKHDANKHWLECACGHKSDEANHEGGVATTTEKAVCTVCQQPYGDLLTPKFTVYFDVLTWENVTTPYFNGNVMTPTTSEYGQFVIEVEQASLNSFKLDFKQGKQNEKDVWFHVTVAGLADSQKDDTNYQMPYNFVEGKEYKVTIINWHHDKAYDDGNEINKFYTCTVEEIIPHVCDFGTELKHNAENHWKECACGEKSEVAPHVQGTEFHHDGTNHWTQCVCGVKSELVAHTYAETWSKGEETHWHECACGQKNAEAAHTWNEGTITKEPTETETGLKEVECSVCGQEKEITLPVTTHECEFGTEFHHDETHHWTQCSCGEKSELVEHTPGTELKHNEENHWTECECGAKFDETAHSISEDYMYDEENHWKDCVCGVKFEETAHAGGTATTTEKAKCSTCNQEYGDYKQEVGYTFRINGIITSGKEVDKGNDNAKYKVELKKGDKVVISKDGTAISGVDYDGTEFATPHNGTYTFYVNDKDEVYVRLNLTIYTNGWASDCAAFYLYYWNADGDAWTKMTIIDEAAYTGDKFGDKADVEVYIDIAGFIVCEMNADNGVWGNRVKQSSDTLYVSGTNVYKVYLD